MFIVYATCKACGDETEIASFDNEKDARVYAAAQRKVRAGFVTHIAEEK